MTKDEEELFNVELILSLHREQLRQYEELKNSEGVYINTILCDVKPTGAFRFYDALGNRYNYKSITELTNMIHDLKKRKSDLDRKITKTKFNTAKSILDRSITKGVLVPDKNDRPRRMNCYNCLYYRVWNHGYGYPCGLCKRNSMNQNKPCQDFFQKMVSKK